MSTELGPKAQAENLRAERAVVVERMARLTEEINEILDAGDPADSGKQERFRNLESGFERARETLSQIDARIDSLAAARRDGLLDAISNPVNVIGDGLNLRDNDPLTKRSYGADPWRGLDDLTLNLGPAEVRARAIDAATQAIGATDDTRERMVDIIEKEDGPQANLARVMLLSSHPEYVRAFEAYMTGDGALLTDGEVRAVRRVRQEQRAMGLTGAAGGFLVPTQLDPNIVITGAGNLDDISRIARNVTAYSSTWKGVTAAQVTASWDAEAAEVSDDSPTLTQPTISLYKSAAFIQASIELELTTPNLSSEIRKLLGDGHRNLEAEAFATGSGSAQPFGVVTSVGATTASRVTAETNDTFGIEDVYATYDALPARYRGNARWAMNPIIASKIRQFGTADGHSFWASLSAGEQEQLLGSPTSFSSFMDGALGTGNDDVLLYGDFENYVIARRIGVVVERVEHMFSTSNGRPTGERGFYAYSYLGADVVNADAFRLLRVEVS